MAVAVFPWELGPDRARCLSLVFLSEPQGEEGIGCKRAPPKAWEKTQHILSPAFVSLVGAHRCLGLEGVGEVEQS